MTSRYLAFAPDALLSDSLRRHGYALDASCGGAGKCGKCRVDVLDAHGVRRSVLACRTLGADLLVDVSALPTREKKIFSPDENAFDASISLVEQERLGELALAVDLGTTTIVCAVLSLSTGRTLCVKSARNPQLAYGRDVISRIFAANDPSAANKMRRAARKAVGLLALEALNELKLSEFKIVEVVVSGNTAMEFLFAGRNVRSLGEAPFRVDRLDFDASTSAEYDWPWNRARVRLMPCCSAFVGGDVLAGYEYLRVKGVWDDARNIALLDVGTNGEIWLTAGGKRYATATAAGPAFEGAEISQGSLAVEGAICSIDFSADGRRWNAQTIGDAPSISVCGSGLIDALAAGLTSGLILPDGRISERAAIDVPELSARILGSGRARAIAISNVPDAHDAVTLTQRDLRQAQLALGAMKVGAKLLCQTARVDASQLDALYLAGGFGASLDRRNARRVGAIPPELELDRCEYCGNSSLLGAAQIALGNASYEQALDDSRTVEIVDLAACPDFAQAFADAMRF